MAPRLIVGISVLASVALAAQQPERRQPPLVIRHVSVVDPAAGTVAADMTVVIDGGQIMAVDTNATPPRGATVVDGQRRYLLPGLWDMHVHLSYARASALSILVAYGVTAVRDVGSDLSEIDAWRAQADISPVIVRAGPMLNGMEFNRYQLAVTDAAEARTAVRTLQKAGVDFIKLHRRTSREAYFAIAEQARALKLPFIGHIPMTVTPAEASDAGQASIEHTETLFEGTFTAARAGKDLATEIARWRTSEAEALFAKFVANGTLVDPTLIAQEYVVRQLESAQSDPNAMYIAASARQEREKTLAGVRPQAEKFLADRKPFLRELRAVTALMSERGVPLLAGTDTSFLHPPGIALHEELEAMVATGVTTRAVLQAAITNPARLFPSLQTGQVVRGQRADLLLLDGNPLVDIRNTRRIRAVVIGGRLLDRNVLDRMLRDAAALAARE